MVYPVYGALHHGGDGAVVINARESVKKTHEIEMFRYALSRKENLDKLVKMHDSIDYSRPLSNVEMEHVKLMRKSGESWGRSLNLSLIYLDTRCLTTHYKDGTKMARIVEMNLPNLADWAV